MKRFMLLLVAVFVLGLSTGCEHRNPVSSQPEQKIGRVQFRTDFLQNWTTVLHPGGYNRSEPEILEAVGGRLPDGIVFSSSDTTIFEVRNVSSGLVLLSKRPGTARLRFVASDGQTDSVSVEVVRRFATSGLQKALMLRIEFSDTTFQNQILVPKQKGRELDLHVVIAGGQSATPLGFGFIRPDDSMTLVLAQRHEFGGELIEANLVADGYYSALGTFKTTTPFRPSKTGKCSIFLQ